jgi:ribosomal protein S9
MSTSTAKYDIKVQLTGRNGNAYAIMSAVSKALRQAGVSEEEINQYQDESMSGDYNNLLNVAAQWVNVQ